MEELPFFTDELFEKDHVNQVARPDAYNPIDSMVGHTAWAASSIF